MANQNLNAQSKGRTPNTTEPGLNELHHNAAANLTRILQHSTHPSPLIQELCEYATTAKQRIAIAASVPQFSIEKACQFLSCLPPEAVREGYRGVVTRLRRETTYLAELADVGVAEIIAGDLEATVDGAQIRFFSEAECESTSIIHARGALGAYNHDQKSILIKGDQPSEALRWRSLIAHGALPPEIATIDHELTHHAQRLGGTWDRILTEVHAYIAPSDSPSYLEPRIDERHETIHHVHRLFGDSPESMRRIMVAYDYIKALKLFGLNDREVGEIVGRDSYDESRKGYPLLRSRLLQALDELELDREVLPLTIKALKARQTIELAVHRANARAIAHEELLAVTAKSALNGY